jgi:predicted small integral membrane protein
MVKLDAFLGLGVMVSTAATDAVYVMFNVAVSSKRRVPAATWSSVWYLLSAFAVISYTKNWVYVCFAAAGSWVGAYISMTWLSKAKGPRGREAV